MNSITDIAERYAQEVAAYTDRHAENFLRKNGIKFTNIEDTNKLLREKGYRLIDEVEGDAWSDCRHTLLLVKIIDQTSYTIKAPKLELDGGK